MTKASESPTKALLMNATTSDYMGKKTSDVESLGPDHAKESRLVSIIKCVGPGLMLGLANSNAGDLLAAAQSGAKYMYLYLTWVTLLIPPLYLSTELVTRICVVNKKPLLVLVNEACGKTLTLIAIFVLAVSCMGGLVMQICTFVAVGGIWGIGGVPVCLLVTAVFVFIVLTDSVSQMEKVGIFFGLFECAFCISACLAKADGSKMEDAVASFDVSLHSDHATITGAIIGAVLMPWMFFYQGSSVIRNKITVFQLDHERLDITLGTIASQVTMASILITFAAAMGRLSGVDLDTIAFADIPGFLSLSLPHAYFLFSMGMVGASFVASLAIALTISWALEEAMSMGFLGNVSEEVEGMSPKLGFTAAVVVACMLSLTGIQAISMIIFCDIVNSLTVLLVILLILLLSESHLPADHAVVGVRKALTFGLMLFMGVCGFVSAICHMFSVFTGAGEGTSEITRHASFTLQWRYSIMNGASGEHISSRPFIYLSLALPMVAAQFALVPMFKRWSERQ